MSQPTRQTVLALGSVLLAVISLGAQGEVTRPGTHDAASTDHAGQPAGPARASVAEFVPPCDGVGIYKGLGVSSSGSYNLLDKRYGGATCTGSGTFIPLIELSVPPSVEAFVPGFLWLRTGNLPIPVTGTACEYDVVEDWLYITANDYGCTDSLELSADRMVDKQDCYSEGPFGWGTRNIVLTASFEGATTTGTITYAYHNVWHSGDEELARVYDISHTLNFVSLPLVYCRTPVDLSILEATPVQAALTGTEPHRLPDINGNGIGDLVAEKPTAFLVAVGVDAPTHLPTETVEVAVEIDGRAIPAVVRKGDFAWDGSRWVAETILKAPLGVSGSKITYLVDPGNKIQETNEENNRREEAVDVKSTQRLHVAYVPIPECIGACYADGKFDSQWPITAHLGTRFMSATYPIAYAQEFLLQPLPGDPSNVGTASGVTEGIVRDILTVGKYRAIGSPTSQVGVGLVPPGYFSYHLAPGVGGLTFTHSKAGLVQVGFTSAIAHEVGHMFGLEPAAPEEYTREPLGGTPAEGYYVETGARSRASEASTTQNLCFMGTALLWPNLGEDGKPPERWIDAEHWAQLFRALRMDPVDPELLVISAILRKDGTIDLDSWSVLPSGIADQSVPGDPSVAIRVLSASNEVLSEYAQPVSFEAHVDPLGVFPTDSVPLVVRIAFPKNAVSVEMVRDDTVVARVSPISKVLRDSINAISVERFHHGPDKDYILNRTLPHPDPEQIRKALLDEIDALEKLLAQGSYVDALDKLVNVIRVQVFHWLVDGRRTTSPLEPTKEQLLKVIDMIIERVSNMAGT